MYIFSPFALYIYYTFEKTKNILEDFGGISFASLTRPHSPTWVTNGFKGLIACAKWNRDSYDNELGFRVLFFILLEDEQKLSVGVFVTMIYEIILCPYFPSFWFI